MSKQNLPNPFKPSLVNWSDQTEHEADTAQTELNVGWEICKGNKLGNYVVDFEFHYQTRA